MPYTACIQASVTKTLLVYIHTITYKLGNTNTLWPRNYVSSESNLRENTSPGYTRKTFAVRVLSFLWFLHNNIYSQFLAHYHEQLLLYIMISFPIVTYSKLEKLRTAMLHTPSTNPLPFLYAIYFLQTTTHNWHSKIYYTYIYIYTYTYVSLRDIEGVVREVEVYASEMSTWSHTPLYIFYSLTISMPVTKIHSK